MVLKYPTRREAPALRLFFFSLRISSVFSELSRPSCALPKDRSRLPAFATSLSRLFRLCPTATSPAFLDAWRFPRSCPQPCHISFSILSSSASHSSRQLDYESGGELLPRDLLARAPRSVASFIWSRVASSGCVGRGLGHGAPLQNPCGFSR